MESSKGKGFRTIEEDVNLKFSWKEFLETNALSGTNWDVAVLASKICKGFLHYDMHNERWEIKTSKDHFEVKLPFVLKTITQNLLTLCHEFLIQSLPEETSTSMKDLIIKIKTTAFMKDVFVFLEGML